jgi:signal transduction histidine kinase
MKSAVTTAAAVLAAYLWTGAALADGLGTAREARDMLKRAVAEMKRDKDAAIAKFNRGEDGFRDRDLYVFCAGPDGTTLAHANPKQVGMNLKELQDKKGKLFGREIFAVAREGKVTQVSYMWPRPGGGEPVKKMSYVTKVAGDVCGVGYYK